MEKQPYIRLNLSSDHSGRRLGTNEIVELIKKQITAHSSFEGCRLPPVRVLAHQLGISKNTVQTAYEELKAQGLVESRNRAGLFVLGGSEPVSIEAKGNVPKLEIKKMTSIRKINYTTKGIIQLSSVFIDPKILPIEKMSACFRSVLKSPGIPEFPDKQGLPVLRKKIADRLNDRGMNVDAKHIVITNGSMQALDIVSRAIKTKIVATENPAFHGAKSLFEVNGLKTIGLPIDPFSGINEKKWEESLAKEKPGLVYLTTNFQNPNGYSYTSSEIAKIIDWSQEFGFGILEDDWGSDMLSFSEFKPGLRTLGGDEVFYMNSFTKKLIPSLRIGYRVSNNEGLESVLMAKNISTSAVPGIMESALFEFLDRGYYDTHLKYIQEELDIRYNSCLSHLRELMPEEVKWTTPGGGPVLWLEMPEKIDLKKLSQAMLNKNIGIQLSIDAFFGKPHLHGFKIGYAYLNVNEMESALETLAKEIKRLMNV